MDADVWFIIWRMWFASGRMRFAPTGFVRFCVGKQLIYPCVHFGAGVAKGIGEDGDRQLGIRIAEKDFCISLFGYLFPVMLTGCVSRGCR